MRSPILYFLVFSFSAVSWIILLSGVSSVQYWCGGGCREALGIPWWLVWFQFLVFFGLVINFTILRTEVYKGIRAILLSFLTMTSLLAMIVADRSLNYKGVPTLATARVNTAAAGAIMTAIFDMLFIVLLSLEDIEGGKMDPMSSHHNPVADPPLPPMPASRPASSV
eukprot:jgi/Botrbrau1/17686/Bobra.0166s0110.1